MWENTNHQHHSWAINSLVWYIFRVNFQKNFSTSIWSWFDAFLGGERGEGMMEWDASHNSVMLCTNNG